MITARRSFSFLLTLVAAAPMALQAQIAADRVPLRTALADISTLRTEYAEAYNKKDAAGIAKLYAKDAVSINADGSVLNGYDAILGAMKSGAAEFPHLVISSDTVQVYGATAIDQGLATMHPAGGGEVKARYLVVLRRDMNGWKILRHTTIPLAPAPAM
ncbi:MAG: nuclear transport factor 2 family protein [Gemmatimonadales bacterium]|nr:nuclear transport factor 2 family protein [Gemmatimonadales bacterium]